jgi:hypothetical protein
VENTKAVRRRNYDSKRNKKKGQRKEEGDRKESERKKEKVHSSLHGKASS